MFSVNCEVCGEVSAGIAIVYSNPKPEFCDKCHSELSKKEMLAYFCSWTCLIKWVSEQSQDSSGSQDQSSPTEETKDV